MTAPTYRSCHHWEGHAAADEHFFGLARASGLRAEPRPDCAGEMACLFDWTETQPSFVHRIVWAEAAAEPAAAGAIVVPPAAALHDPAAAI